MLDAKIRVVLLQLFQRWSRLDSGPNVGVPALVHALDIVDVKVDIDDVTEVQPLSPCLTPHIEIPFF